MEKKVKKETMWAIVGNCGLYCGTYLTRRDAINRFIARGNNTWAQRKKLGDRAVKVTITYHRPQH